MKEACPRRGLVSALLVAVGSTLVCHTVAAQQLDPIVPAHVAVRLRPEISLAEFNARWGSERTGQNVAVYGLHVVDIANVPGNPTEDEFARMVGPDTTWAQSNYMGDAPESFGSGRNFFCTINRNAAAYNDQGAWNQINLATAHQVTTGAGTIVAIIDTGVDATHPVLAERVLANGWNFILNNSDTSDYALATDRVGSDPSMAGHGTHMAGIIAKIAPDAMILPIKVLDRQGVTDTFMMSQGIYYAIDQGVDVINISIGSTHNSASVIDALQAARQRGIVVVAAAGNVAMDNDPNWEFPALNEDTLGVVAVDDEDERAAFSNINNAFAISAPGVGIFSTIPDNQYGDLDGTSTSTPMVAGTAALVIAAHPQWLRNEARTIQVHAFLRQSSFDIDILNPGLEGRLGDGRLDAGGAVNTAVVFDRPVAYPAPSRPSAIASADFDGDFLLDLAVVSLESDSVSISLNLGNGTYASGSNYAVGSAPTAVVASDLNNDGRTDLAIANRGDDTVSILLNRGDGSFLAAIAYQTGQSPSALVAGDFDADGDIDLAAAGSGDGSGDITVLLNNGSASFAVGRTLTLGGPPTDLIAAKLNQDGLIDLAAVSGDTDRMYVLLNRGGATFAPAVSYVVGSHPLSLVGGNFDSDPGDSIDIAVANEESEFISMLLNSGDGTFTAGADITVLAGERNPVDLVAADFDCDGDIDLAALSDEEPPAASVLLNDGQAIFLARLDFSAGLAPSALTTADLDDDGDADLAIVDADARAGEELLVLINRTCASQITGDMNCDGWVNAFDIEPFVMALLDPAGYETAYPDCDLTSGDTNRDGVVDAFDIEPFLALLFGG